MIDVPNVKSDPFVPLDVFPAVDLGPACDARSHLKHPEFFLGVLVDRPGMVGERRARADEAHVAFQNIDGLRQLVDRRGADDPSDLRHAAVAFAAVYARACVLRVDHHRAEFVHIKCLVVFAESHLLEDDRSLGLQFDRDSRDQKYGPQDQQNAGRDDDIKASLDVVLIHVLFLC